jgi:hypothetical protein
VLGLVRVSKFESLKDEFAQQAQCWKEFQCLRVIWSKKVRAKSQEDLKFKD